MISVHAFFAYRSTVRGEKHAPLQKNFEESTRKHLLGQSSSRDARKRFEICSKLIIKTPVLH